MKRVIIPLLGATAALLFAASAAVGTARMAHLAGLPTWASPLFYVASMAIAWWGVRRLTRPTHPAATGSAIPAVMSRWDEPTDEWIDSTHDWTDSPSAGSGSHWANDDLTDSLDDADAWLDGDVDPESVWSGPATQPEAALAERAARLIVGAQFGSAAFLQRRLRIGFLQAESLLDRMEDAGIVGPRRDGPRDVLIPRGRIDAAVRALARRSR